jgi:hypothetical protein
MTKAKTLAEQFEAAFLGLNQFGSGPYPFNLDSDSSVLKFKDGSVYDHRDCTTYTKKEWKEYCEESELNAVEA